MPCLLAPALVGKQVYNLTVFRIPKKAEVMFLPLWEPGWREGPVVDLSRWFNVGIRRASWDPAWHGQQHTDSCGIRISDVAQGYRQTLKIPMLSRGAVPALQSQHQQMTLSELSNGTAVTEGWPTKGPWRCLTSQRTLVHAASQDPQPFLFPWTGAVEAILPTALIPGLHHIPGRKEASDQT